MSASASSDLVVQKTGAVSAESSLWSVASFSGGEVYSRGVVIEPAVVAQWTIAGDNELVELIKQWAELQNSCFALLVETDSQVIAIVDHIRSIPIYFRESTSFPILADSPHAFLAGVASKPWRRDAIGEMLLSGYVHGRGTLVEGIFQIGAGEMLIADKREGTYQIHSHYTYFPREERLVPESQLIETWASKIDQVFQDVVQKLRTKEVWVPLSGGYDSRLVLSKLCEFHCENIRAFSYGVKNNEELETARHVALELGVEWLCLESDTGTLRSLFRQEKRKKYSALADGLHVTPSTLEFESISRLSQRGVFSNKTVIVNGLSGDFLFGGHVPAELLDQPFRAVAVDKIIDKHCSHTRSRWLDQYTQVLKKKLLLDLDYWAIEDGDVDRLCAFYEHWDWKERQAKAVMVHQRLYEAFDLSWELPLWDRRLVEVASRVPLIGRFQQRTHQKYLEQSRHRELFLIPRVKTRLWQGAWKIVPYLGKLVGVLLGPKTKSFVYRRLFFFGYFRHQLGLFGIREFWRVSKLARPPYVIAVATVSRLRELGIDFWEQIEL